MGGQAEKSDTDDHNLVSLQGKGKDVSNGRQTSRNACTRAYQVPLPTRLANILRSITINLKQAIHLLSTPWHTQWPWSRSREIGVGCDDITPRIRPNIVHFIPRLISRLVQVPH